jgi:hypothetical protein
MLLDLSGEEGHAMSDREATVDPDSVHDRDSFLAFVRALAADRRASVSEESQTPSALLSAQARGWENSSIESFLEASLRWAEDTGMGVSQGLPPDPTWRSFAVFLYCGKIYE